MESGENHRRELGRVGEDIACEYLQKHGHTVLKRNYRSGHLEIDIITRNGDGIHFVEVKCRQFGIQAPPQESVNFIKQKRTAAAAGRFLKSPSGRRFCGMECFFDVFAVTFNADSVTTEWIPQAYIPVYI